MPDRIEKVVELEAPIDRVWRAVTDPEEFGQWFRVKLDTPFAVGEMARGRITHPGYEHLKWEVKVVRMEKPRLFAFEWHPYAIDPNVDYSKEPPTRVEFRLEPNGDGTRLIIVESGFDRIPAHRRDEAMRGNESGWAAQMDNIRAHVDA